MRGLRRMVRSGVTAATLTGVVFAGATTAGAAGPPGAARPAAGADRAAAPGFSGSTPALDGLAKGERELAVAMYERTRNRWRAFAELELAN